MRNILHALSKSKAFYEIREVKVIVKKRTTPKKLIMRFDPFCSQKLFDTARYQIGESTVARKTLQ